MNDVVATGAVQAARAEVISRESVDAVVKLHVLGPQAIFGDFLETVSKFMRNGYAHRPQPDASAA